MSKPTKALDPRDLDAFRRDPKATGLLFDLDGTLSPIVDDPMNAPFSEATRAKLARLAPAYGLIAVVSGRAAHALLDIVKLPELTYVGNHGLEILHRGQRRVLVGEDDVLRLRKIAEQMEPRLENEPGIFFEDKELSLSIHYRRAPNEERAVAFIHHALASVDLRGFRIRGGKKLVQVRPDVPVDKGTTVVGLLREKHLVGAVYAGDDLTDLDVFRALGSLRGEGFRTLCIGVVDPETVPQVLEEADCVVEGLGGMERVLQWLAP